MSSSIILGYIEIVFNILLHYHNSYPQNYFSHKRIIPTSTQKGGGLGGTLVPPIGLLYVTILYIQ